MLEYFADDLRPAVLVRRGPGAFVSGEWMPGAEVRSSIRIITPQAVRWEELSPSEQGEGVAGWAKTWTAANVRTRRGDDDPDVIEYEGERFLVMTSEPWPQGGFRKIVMRRADDR